MWSKQTLKTLFSAKKLLFGNECLKIIAETASEVGRTAAMTLGPMGRNVCIENDKGEPRITKDGVTVIKHIDYEDRLQDAVCTLIKHSANGTNRFAGDGTTTSALLISQIVKEGRRSLEAGVCIRDIKQGLQVGRNLGIEFLKMAAQRISTVAQLVAMIATKGDELLSSLVSEAVAKSQIIKVQKTHLTHSYVEFYTGIKMVAGIPHPEFKNVGDKVELDYPLVLLDQIGISKVQDIVAALQLAKKARKQLLIVSSAISDSVLSTLIYNKRKNIVQAFPVILHNYGTVPKQYMRQLALTTEATIFGPYGPSIRDVEYKHLGRAIRVDMDLIETSVLGKRSDVCTNAVIYAGGSTEAVALQIYDKIIDALNSVQTAKKHGVVAGGGVTYWRMADMLEAYRGQFQPGVKVLAKALRSPRRKLVQALPQAYKALGGVGWQGFNFKTRQMQDMIVAGVIDSAIVGQSVLVDAISLGRMLLDISVCVVRDSPNIQNKKQIQQITKQYKL